MGLEDNQGSKICLPHPSSTWWQWVVLPRVSVEFMHCLIAALCKKNVVQQLIQPKMCEFQHVGTHSCLPSPPSKKNENNPPSQSPRCIIKDSSALLITPLPSLSAAEKLCWIRSARISSAFFRTIGGGSHWTWPVSCVRWDWPIILGPMNWENLISQKIWKWKKTTTNHIDSHSI